MIKIKGTTKKMTKQQVWYLQFPWKLHVILDNAEERGQNDIISWMPNGKAFQIHDKEKFAKDIMPEYFHTSVYKSFQRNMNIWGFRTVARGLDLGVFANEFFIRGEPDLCRSMTRVSSVKNNKQSLSTNVNDVNEEEEHGNVKSEEPILNRGTNLPSIECPPSVDLLVRPDNIQQWMQVQNAFKAAEVSIPPASNFPVQSACTKYNMMFNSEHLIQAAQDLIQIQQLQKLLQQPQQQQQHMLQMGRYQALVEPNISERGTSYIEQTCGSLPPPSLSDTNKFYLRCGGSNPISTEEKIVNKEEEDAASKNDSSKKVRRVPCKARKMPIGHNPMSACFLIHDSLSHGDALVCSHPACREGGVKFLYCSYCKNPVAKRAFRNQHDHRNDGDHIQEVVEKKDEKKQATMLTGVAAQPASAESLVPSSPFARLCREDGEESKPSSSSSQRGVSLEEVIRNYTESMSLAHPAASSFSSRPSNNDSSNSSQLFNHQELSTLLTGTKHGPQEIETKIGKTLVRSDDDFNYFSNKPPLKKRKTSEQVAMGGTHAGNHQTGQDDGTSEIAAAALRAILRDNFT